MPGTQKEPEKPLSTQVAELAALQFSRAEIELMLGLDAGRLGDDEALSVCYRRGALIGEADVRRGIKSMACEGKSQAGSAFLELVDRRKARDRAVEKSRSGPKKAKGRRR